ncbi:hypothetical protein VCHA53O466_50185 [Vibrio chagasii]|nr:hypothetical protein VCHA53O466_50185 [Vibrio chagasii]
MSDSRFEKSLEFEMVRKAIKPNQDEVILTHDLSLLNLDRTIEDGGALFYPSVAVTVADSHYNSSEKVGFLGCASFGAIRLVMKKELLFDDSTEIFERDTFTATVPELLINIDRDSLLLSIQESISPDLHSDLRIDALSDLPSLNEDLMNFNTLIYELKNSRAAQYMFAKSQNLLPVDDNSLPEPVVLEKMAMSYTRKDVFERFVYHQLIKPNTTQRGFNCEGEFLPEDKYIPIGDIIEAAMEDNRGVGSEGLTAGDIDDFMRLMRNDGLKLLSSRQLEPYQALDMAGSKVSNHLVTGTDEECSINHANPNHANLRSIKEGKKLFGQIVDSLEPYKSNPAYVKNLLSDIVSYAIASNHGAIDLLFERHSIDLDAKNATKFISSAANSYALNKVPYIEAKIGRRVELSDVAYIVCPDFLEDGLKEVMKDAGLDVPVSTYSSEGLITLGELRRAKATFTDGKQNLLELTQTEQEKSAYQMKM